MSDKDKYSFIVVKYPQKDKADAALQEVLSMAKEKVVKLRDAAVITKTEKGKIKLHQTKDDATSKGLLKGGVIGVIIYTRIAKDRDGKPAHLKLLRWLEIGRARRRARG